MLAINLKWKSAVVALELNSCFIQGRYRQKIAMCVCSDSYLAWEATARASAEHWFRQIQPWKEEMEVWVAKWLADTP